MRTGEIARRGCAVLLTVAGLGAAAPALAAYARAGFSECRAYDYWKR